MSRKNDQARTRIAETAERYRQVLDQADALIAAGHAEPGGDAGLMGHRYREGHLSEVVIAGQPFLKLEPAGGAPEFYRPDAVYCLTPVTATLVPRAAITERFDDVLDDEDFGDDDAEDPF